MMDCSMVFKGDTMMESKKQALEEAIKDRTGLVLWTDESKLDKGRYERPSVGETQDLVERQKRFSGGKQRDT